eukprot:IDg2427t1
MVWLRRQKSNCEKISTTSSMRLGVVCSRAACPRLPRSRVKAPPRPVPSHYPPDILRRDHSGMLCIDCYSLFRKPKKATECRKRTRTVLTAQVFPCPSTSQGSLSKRRKKECGNGGSIVLTTSQREMPCTMPIGVILDIFKEMSHRSFRVASGRPSLGSCDLKIIVTAINILSDSLRVVASGMLNGETRDSTLESLAAISPASTQCIAISTYDAYAKMIWEAAENVGRDSIERAKEQFIIRGGGSVAIDRRMVASSSSVRALRSNDDSSGPFNKNGEEPKRVVVRAHTGNYVGSSKSMEAEGTRKIFEQMGEDGRGAIAALVSDEDGGLKKLKELHSDLAHIPLYVDPGHYAKNRKKKQTPCAVQLQARKLYRDATNVQARELKGGFWPQFTTRQIWMRSLMIDATMLFEFFCIILTRTTSAPFVLMAVPCK